MQIQQHNFTQTIVNILNKYFPGYGNIILNNSQLLQYINIKLKPQIVVLNQEPVLLIIMLYMF
jgi:hypothetical protein